MTDVIQSLWIGGALSTMERLSIASFLANGHEYHLYSYGCVGGAPDGVVLKDAEEILSSDQVFANDGEDIGKHGFAGFSDWFRYELLSRRGGWWCDSDLVCLRPFQFEQETVIATSREQQWGTTALGCALRLPPEDPLLKFCLNVCRTSDIRAMVAKDYPAVGPHLLQQGIRQLELSHYQVGPDAFCSISWRHTRFFTTRPHERWLYNAKRFIRGGEMVEDIKPSSYGLHLWNSTWALGGLSKEGTYPRSSIYETLKRKYLPSLLRDRAA